MAYAVGNPKTKKALKEKVANGEEVRVFYPGIEGPLNGRVFIEGPHYPAPHTWYAQVECQDGRITKVVK